MLPVQPLEGLSLCKACSLMREVHGSLLMVCIWLSAIQWGLHRQQVSLCLIWGNQHMQPYCCSAPNLVLELEIHNHKSGLPSQSHSICFLLQTLLVNAHFAMTTEGLHVTIILVGSAVCCDGLKKYATSQNKWHFTTFFHHFKKMTKNFWAYFCLFSHMLYSSCPKEF